MYQFTNGCPICRGPWTERADLIGVRTGDFDGCAFQCHTCGIGFSNAKRPGARVRITRDPELNVPTPARSGLAEALAGAINETSRTKKRRAFCSANSEDAVTWTVVNALLAEGRLDALMGEPSRGGEPEAVLAWGHALAGRRGAEVARALIAVSNRLGEVPQRRSEPDVIVMWPDELVVIEAKFQSANDAQPHYPNYNRYLVDEDLFQVSADDVVAEGSYQLTRNWVIGSQMARDLDCKLRLVNLGPDGLDASSFADLLGQDDRRRFESRTWRDVLDGSPRAGWLHDYATAVGLRP